MGDSSLAKTSINSLPEEEEGYLSDPLEETEVNEDDIVISTGMSGNSSGRMRNSELKRKSHAQNNNPVSSPDNANSDMQSRQGSKVSEELRFLR